jgi:nucleoside-diphosphate kinase
MLPATEEVGGGDAVTEGCESQAPADERNIFVERTLAVVKPDAMYRYEEIEDIIIRSGFTILEKRRVHMTAEQTSDLYAEHFGKLFFPSLVAYMSSGPIMALMLARDQAVLAWNQLIGPANVILARANQPASLRARYGTDEQRNGLHGSSSDISAQRELRFFFGDAVIEPIAVGQLSKDYLARAVNPTLLKGLTELCKNKPENPAKWLSDWLLANNPYKAKIKETPCMVFEPPF